MPSKKKKKQDFQKVKLKVGRKLPRPANETRTQFKVRGIDIKSQFHSDKTAVEAGGVEPSAANIKVCSAVYFVNIYSVCIFCHHWLIIDTARSRVCMVSIHLFVYLSVHLSLFHLLAAAVWGGFVAVNLVDRRCRSIMSGAGRCSSTAYSNMAFRSKCEQFHVCRQGTRLNTDCLLSYSLLYFYFYFVIGMSGRAFSLYLSSWHSLLERSHVHNWMRVFWRCCLLPHIGRTGVKWSQVRFNGSGPRVVGSSWRSFPVLWMLENHSSNCTVMVLDDGRAFSQTQSHYTSTPITHPPLDSVWPDHGGHGPR